jgi:hypothetical protein
VLWALEELRRSVNELEAVWAEMHSRPRAIKEIPPSHFGTLLYGLVDWAPEEQRPSLDGRALEARYLRFSKTVHSGKKAVLMHLVLRDALTFGPFLPSGDLRRLSQAGQPHATPPN